MKATTAVGVVTQLLLLTAICYVAYDIRLFAVKNYGPIIHEFDPWFNFRVTQYIVDHGWRNFTNWFDEMVWYPIGRHVGSTTYPGMMVTSALLFRAGQLLGLQVSLNDVCVYVPAIFGVIASLFTFGLAREVAGSGTAGVIAAAVMAMIPAHLMRSVAGGYDNESVAVSIIVATFYFWVRSLRTEKSWPIGVLTGLSYIYMAATWGAYTFVLNMVGLHAGLMVLLGRFTFTLHKAYSLFFVIGTLGAIQFPMVGYQPFTSMEQLMPLGVFFGLQLWAYLEYTRTKMESPKKFQAFRAQVITFAVLVAAVMLGVLMNAGYLASFSARVRSLFIPHTHTGNPLVDSVAEHQATPQTYYWQYFHYTFYVAPIGAFFCLFRRTEAKYFALVYYATTYYFSQKMVRLVLLLSPSTSILVGVAIGTIVDFTIKQVVGTDTKQEEVVKEEEDSKTKKKDAQKGKPQPQQPPQKGQPSPKTGKQSTKKSASNPSASATPRYSSAIVTSVADYFTSVSDHLIDVFPPAPRPLKLLVGLVLICVAAYGGRDFYKHCWEMAPHLSEPQVIMKATTHGGQTVVLDDFREAYWWLRDKTPEDARVLAWWDYGYQINGIGNRTSIADGNTWNHEHIALLGKSLISTEEESHKIIRHLADYVLVWTTRWVGMYGDDLAKMPHMAKIAGSVYPEVKPQEYWMDQEGNFSPTVKNCLLYKLSVQGVTNENVKLTKFEEAFRSKHLMVRIYKVKDVAKRTPFGKYAPQLKLGKFRG